MGKLKNLLEAYRWLWSAERRWHPASRWVSGARFSARVVADILRAVLSPPYGGTMISLAKRVALASAAVVFALALVMQEEEQPSAEDSTWAYQDGGFTVAIPASWEESAAEAEPSSPEPPSVLAGSEHRRKIGGLLRPRYLSTRTLDLGVVPMGMRIREFADLVTRARAPHETLGRAAPAAAGVYIVTSRSLERGNPISQAGIFFRGLEGHAFMIEVTSHRSDEAILIEEAWRIADSVQHDVEALTDLAIPLSESFAVPFGFIQLTPRIVPDSAGTIVLDVPAHLVADVASMDACRNAAITFWARGLQEATSQGLVFSRPIEMRVSCQTSSVLLRFDPAESRMMIRQVDAAGSVRLEMVRASFWILPSWG